MMMQQSITFVSSSSSPSFVSLQSYLLMTLMILITLINYNTTAVAMDGRYSSSSSRRQDIYNHNCDSVGNGAFIIAQRVQQEQQFYHPIIQQQPLRSSSSSESWNNNFDNNHYMMHHIHYNVFNFRRCHRWWLLTKIDSSMDDKDINNNNQIVYDEIEKLRRKAQELREEASSIRQAIVETASLKEMKRIQNIDKWMNRLFFKSTYGQQELLNTVNETVSIIINDRYSPEQIFQVFDRLYNTTKINGRDSIQTNMLLELLITSVGKVDEIEREYNDNKRWNNIVERTLHKRLFAIECGIDYVFIEEEKRSKQGY